MALRIFYMYYARTSLKVFYMPAVLQKVYCVIIFHILKLNPQQIF